MLLFTSPFSYMPGKNAGQEQYSTVLWGSKGFMHIITMLESKTDSASFKADLSKERRPAAARKGL